MDYKVKLIKEAEKFILYLKENKVEALVNEKNNGLYSLKLDIVDFGLLTLFYSPKKDSFKINTSKIDNPYIAETILKLWEEYYTLNCSNSIYKNTGFEIDVDGSYINGKTGWGAVIRKDGKIEQLLSGLVKTDNIKNSHQIAGEIKAVLESVRYCKKNSINEVTIYYDYNGLKYWAQDKWKTKQYITEFYKNYMKNIDIKIDWVKIKSHSGSYWNEKADELAKKAVGFDKTKIN